MNIVLNVIKFIKANVNLHYMFDIMNIMFVI